MLGIYREPVTLEETRDPSDVVSNHYARTAESSVAMGHTKLTGRPNLDEDSFNRASTEPR